MPQSVAPGDEVALKLSASASGSATMQLHRLVESADGSVGDPIGDPTTIEVASQPVPALAWQDGCGWPTTATLTIDPAARSGLYSARISMAEGPPTDVVFVVRPAPDADPAPLLVLANTNCWNAYNAWGGRSNYSVINTGISLSFERPNPETVPDVRTAHGWTSNHLTAAEIWLLSWLEEHGCRYDVCSDADLHGGVVDLSRYRALVLSTHPEYWSRRMAVRVSDYVDGGGHILYLGGNGVFRTVEYSDDALTMRTGAGAPFWSAEAWSPDGPLLERCSVSPTT